jgi:hypothetical protein
MCNICLFDACKINIYFLFCRTNSVRGFIIYVVNHGRVGKYIMRKSKRYIYIYLLFVILAGDGDGRAGE